MLLLAPREELLPIPRHELERSSFGEPYVYPLEELELSWEFPVTYWLHRGFLLVAKEKKAVVCSVEYLAKLEQLLKDLERSVDQLESVLRRLKQRHEVWCVDSVHLRVVYRSLLDPLLGEPTPVRLEPRSHPHLLP